MNDTKYNGWSNYETWCVAMWISNDRSQYDYWNEMSADAKGSDDPPLALAEFLKEQFNDNRPELTGCWADLLGAALSEVNWFEIAEDLLHE